MASLSAHRFGTRLTILLTLVVAAFVAIARPSYAQTSTTFAVIADVDQPFGGLIRGSDGHLYGTSRSGPGWALCGYVYRLELQTDGSYLRTILHEFTGIPNDGSGEPGDGCQPNGELVESTPGVFYGTTMTGGNPDAHSLGGTGTIYRISASGLYEVLKSFAGWDDVNRYSEGVWPVAGLTLGLDGHLYGANSSGGRGNYFPGLGTLFRYTSAGVLEVFYHFGEDFLNERSPYDALTRGRDGNLYGTLPVVGVYGYPIHPGALFRVTPTGIFSVLAFPSNTCPAAECYALGSEPRAAPTEVNGSFFITATNYGPGTSYGPGGFGTIVRVDPDGTGHLVYSFSAGADGGYPVKALTLGTDGFLYGLTSGANQTGPTIYRIAQDGTSFQTLHEFVLGGDGLQGRLLEVSPGEFLGTSASGGPNGGFVFRLSMNGVNHAPVAFDGVATTDEDVTLYGGQLVATDADNDDIDFEIEANGSLGQATVNAETGEFTYQPYANAFGTDEFRFHAIDVNGGISVPKKVTITINPINDPPQAGDSSVSTPENMAVIGNFAVTDIDSPILQYLISSSGNGGTIELLDTPANSFRYTPHPGVTGTDWFTFLVSDGSFFSAGTVTINIVDANNAPVANEGAVTTNEDTPISGALTGTDPDGDQLSFEIVTSGSLGTAIITNAITGAFIYTPHPNGFGDGEFTFRVTDTGGNSDTATITVRIDAVNDAPVASESSVTTDEDVAVNGLLGGADIDGPSLAFAITTPATKGVVEITNTSTGAFTYTPNPNANGTDEFWFQVSDTVLGSSARVSVSITPVADAALGLSATALSFGNQQVGTTSTAARYPVGSRPASVASADLNGDGHADLVAANQQGHTVSVLMNTGAGLLSAAQSYPTAGANPTSLAVRDFNSDGRPDVAVTNEITRDVSVLLTNGDGTLQTAVRYPAGQGPTAGAFGITSGDFNADGNLDLAVTNTGSAINVLLGDGSGTFAPGATFSASNAIDVASGDFNADDVLDLATARQVFLGVGDGTFGGPQTLNVPQGEFVAIGDFNGDGMLDVASVVNANPNVVAIRLGNGDGTFTAGGNYPVGRGPFFSAAGDLNGDGRADLAVSSRLDFGVNVLLSNADGTFQPYVNYGHHFFTQAVAIADLNGNGTSDLATANFSANNVSVLAGKGDGTFISSLTATIHNTGDAPVVIEQFAIAGGSAAEFFVEAETCPVSLDPGSACVVAVGFAPASGGAKSATLQIISNAEGSPHEVALSGHGRSAPIAQGGSISVQNGTPFTGQLVASDPDGDALNFEIVADGIHGSIVIDPETGVFTYTPNPSAAGEDEFSFRVSDGMFVSNVAIMSVAIAAAPLTVDLIAPNGGERVFATIPATIRWTATGASTIDVALSRNGGTNFTAIQGCTGLSGSATSCSWTPAGPGTSSARIRVTARSAGGTSITDSSNANFAISTATPSITVAAPNTAVTWSVGSTRTIQWNHNLGPNSFVAIDVSRNGGTTWESIAVSVQNPPSGAGSFVWLVTGPETTMGLVRVSSVEGFASDASNVAFSIVAPSITVTTPNTAVTWRMGSTQTLRVSHNLGIGQPISFEVSHDGGGAWTAVGSITTTSQTAGTLSWVVTGPETTQARVRARWTTTPAVLDISDVNFNIIPRVTVTAPNIAVTWGAGSTRLVSWTHNLGTTELVNIELSPDNGSTWLALASGVLNTTATTGSLAVRMPDIVTTQALVRVSPVTFPAEGDVSNVPFTLAAPLLTVTAPNSNVLWTIGSARSVNWSHNLGTLESVNIDVSRDGGITWTPLASDVANTGNASGTWSWAAVTTPATSAARIRVRWGANGNVQDVSNVNFRIQ